MALTLGRAGRGARRSRRLRSSQARRTTWWSLGLLFAALGLMLLPATAHARGRRGSAVPDLRAPRIDDTERSPFITRVGLTVHIASEDGVPVAGRREVEQWVVRANEALRPHGLEVELRRLVPLTGYSEITRRVERRKLASMAGHDGTIHVFITNNLDARASTVRRRVRGLHWRYHGLNRDLRQREYVVVTLGAPKTTFAHEVGHLMGLRHSNSVDNIMCSCRRGGDTTFTDEQGAVMRAGAKRFLSRQHQARQREQHQRYRNLDRARRRQ